MKAWVNDFPLNDLAGSVFIHGAIEGLSVPEIRRTTGLNMGRNGGYHGKPKFGTRSIGIPLTIAGRSIDEYETARVALIKALLIDDGEVTLKLVKNNGEAFIVYCYLKTPDLPYGPNPLYTKFSLELEADDPVIYDDSAGDGFSAPLSKTIPGGFIYPFTYPKVYAPSTRSSSILNSGNIITYPTIVLQGSANNPIIFNHTTNETMLLNVVTGPSDVLTIDNRPGGHTVLLNGASIYNKKSADWISLALGSNDVELTTSTSDDTISGTVYWRGGYMGI